MQRLKNLIDEKDPTMKRISPAKNPTRNVWLQLGLSDAEEHYLKAELVLRLYNAIEALGMTQRTAARRVGATQPGAVEDFSGQVLLRCRLKG